MPGERPQMHAACLSETAPDERQPVLSIVGEGQAASPLDGAERAWFRLRAQIASALWAAMAEEGMGIAALTETAGMPARRVRAILMAEALSVSTGEIAHLAFALGRQWSIDWAPRAAAASAGEEEAPAEGDEEGDAALEPEDMHTAAPPSPRE